MSQREKIEISKRGKRAIEKLVNSGRYASADAVIKRSLQVLEYHDRIFVETIGQLQEKLREGIDDLEAGRVFDGEEVFREIRSRSQAARRRSA